MIVQVDFPISTQCRAIDFWNTCNKTQLNGWVGHTHFKRKWSQKVNRATFCTEWKSALTSNCGRNIRYNFIILYKLFFLMIYLIAKFRFWKLFIKCFHITRRCSTPVLKITQPGSGVASSDNWGVGAIFIYSCSQTLKTIALKRN
jgi:hypothetical protein